MSDWVYSLFFPIVGTICSNVMFSSSLLVVRLSRRQRFLGKSVNPVPWAFGALNSFNWFVYGVIVSDLYIMSSCLLGVIIGIFQCSTAFTLLGAARDDTELKYASTMEEILMCGGVIWLILTYIMVGTGDDALGLFMIGIFSNCTSFAMYLSPMASMLTVIRLKDASSIYAPQILANGVNGACWGIYGLLGVGDVFVWLPGAVAVASSATLLALKAIYPSKVTIVVMKDDMIEGEDKEMNPIAGDHVKLRSTSQENDRKRGYSEGSTSSAQSHSSNKYRGKLRTGSVESIKRSRSRSRSAGTQKKKAFFDRNGMLVRMGSDYSSSHGDISSHGDTDATSEKPKQPSGRGRAATIRAVIQMEDPTAPPPSAAISKIQEVIGNVVEGVRARAESVFQAMEDTVMAKFEPILAVEVMEASTNLQQLYQDHDDGVVDDPNVGVQVVRENRVGSVGAGGAGSGLEPILERDSSMADSSFGGR